MATPSRSRFFRSLAAAKADRLANNTNARNNFLITGSSHFPDSEPVYTVRLTRATEVTGSTWIQEEICCATFFEVAHLMLSCGSREMTRELAPLGKPSCLMGFRGEYGFASVRRVTQSPDINPEQAVVSFLQEFSANCD